MRQHEKRAWFSLKRCVLLLLLVFGEMVDISQASAQPSSRPTSAVLVSSRPVVVKQAPTTLPTTATSFRQERASSDWSQETPLLPSRSTLLTQHTSTLQTLSHRLLLNRHLIYSFRDDRADSWLYAARALSSALDQEKQRCHRIKKYNAMVRCDQIEFRFEPHTSFLLLSLLMESAAQKGFREQFWVVKSTQASASSQERWIKVSISAKPKKRRMKKQGSAPLLLTLSITDNGYNLRTRGMVFPQGCDLSSRAIGTPRLHRYPTLLRTKKGYDLRGLGACLAAVKSFFPEKKRIYLTAERHLTYRTIVEAIEAGRSASGDLYFSDIVLFAE